MGNWRLGNAIRILFGLALASLSLYGILWADLDRTKLSVLVSESEIILRGRVIRTELDPACGGTASGPGTEHRCR